MAMEISHPRRILAVSRPDSGLVDLLKGLNATCAYKRDLDTDLPIQVSRVLRLLSQGTPSQV